MKYYSSLDGIRALAVAVVLLAHSRAPYVPKGWLGVDAFFTLSGFLITSILLAEHDRYGSIILRHFYARRFLRLLPCLWLTVAMVLIVWTVTGHAEAVLADIAYALTYVMNWARAFVWSDDGPLAHTWSLAIEEQYYLLWPLVIGFACKFSKSRLALGWSLLGGAAALMVYRCLLVGTYTYTRVHYGLDTHADPMLIGSALACFSSARQGRPLEPGWSRIVGYLLTPAAAVTLVIVLVTWVSQQEPPVLTIGYPVVGICTAILIIDLTLGTHSLVRALLGMSFLVWVGRISYGVYLYHWPIFTLLKKVGITHWLLLITIGTALTLLVSAASFYLVERRFLQLKGVFSRSGEAHPVPPLRVELTHPGSSINPPLATMQRVNL